MIGAACCASVLGGRGGASGERSCSGAEMAHSGRARPIQSLRVDMETMMIGEAGVT